MKRTGGPFNATAGTQLSLLPVDMAEVLLVYLSRRFVRLWPVSPLTVTGQSTYYLNHVGNTWFLEMELIDGLIGN